MPKTAVALPPTLCVMEVSGASDWISAFQLTKPMASFALSPPLPRVSSTQRPAGRLLLLPPALLLLLPPLLPASDTSTISKKHSVQVKRHAPPTTTTQGWPLSSYSQRGVHRQDMLLECESRIFRNVKCELRI